MLFKKYRKGFVSVMVYVLLGISMLGQVASAENVVRQGELIKIKGVSIIHQYPELPTGCEVTALTMLLKYNGVEISKCDVADHMPKFDLPYYKKGKRYGYHPSQGFIGNPYSRSSYGVYAPVIVKMIEDYLPGRGEDLTGKSFEEILESIDEGIPVMIWASIGMSKVSYTNEWIVNSKGTVFKWPGGEHAVVIVGYDKSYIYINDPYTGTEKRYARGLVEKRFIELGKQAVRIKSKETDKKEEILEIVIDEKIQEISITEMNMMLNEQPLSIEDGYTLVKKENRILIPIKYLPQLVEGLEVSYDEAIIAISHRGKGFKIQLSIAEDWRITTLPNAQTVALHYEVEEGISRVDLEWLSEFFLIPYTVEETMIAIKSISYP